MVGWRSFSSPPAATPATPLLAAPTRRPASRRCPPSTTSRPFEQALRPLIVAPSIVCAWFGSGSPSDELPNLDLRSGEGAALSGGLLPLTMVFLRM